MGLAKLIALLMVLLLVGSSFVGLIIYYIKLKIKPIKELPTSSSNIKRAINFANPIKINPNFP